MSKYILSIDAGTTGITVLLLSPDLYIVDRAYSEFEQIYPQPGWVEHNPVEIWKLTETLIKQITAKNNSEEIISIGITNQRETTVLWNRNTGKPINNAIVWQDRRTKPACDFLKENGLENIFKKKTGLVLDSYFSGTKIKWILDNIPDARESAESGDLLFGTIDTWLLWNLTAGKSHKTDFTNASRTLIFNITEKCWDEELLQYLNIPYNILPEVCNSMSDFGTTRSDLFSSPVPVTGIAGDQQAALFGQCGFLSGEVKTTYGTGCFMMVNTGEDRINSSSGCLTTLACNEKGEPVFALEGSVFIGGAVIQWLRDELKFITKASETEAIAESLTDTGGVYVVPAFAGLGAPYWDMDARGTITGLTRGSGRSQIIRAALESIAYQVNDLFSSITNDLNISIHEMKVDGGAVKNNFLMQFQSDVLNITVIRPQNIETTALGAGMLAGLQSGVWKSSEELHKCQRIDKTFPPQIEDYHRKTILTGWEKAVNKTLIRN